MTKKFAYLRPAKLPHPTDTKACDKVLAITLNEFVCWGVKYPYEHNTVPEPNNKSKVGPNIPIDDTNGALALE